MMLLPERTATSPSPRLRRVVSIFSILLLIAMLGPSGTVYAAIDIKINGVPVVSDVNSIVSGLRHAEAGYGLAEAGIVTRTSATAESGGQVSGAGEVSAEATVRNIIENSGARSNVDIRVNTGMNGEHSETSVSRVLERGEELEVRIEGAAEGSIETETGGAHATSSMPTLFARFYEAVSKMAATLFFFLQ